MEQQLLQDCHQVKAVCLDGKNKTRKIMNEQYSLFLPKGYHWLLEQGLVGFNAFSQLQPWFFIEKDKMFWANEFWQKPDLGDLLVFARRQDCDDLACFMVDKTNQISGVLVIQGWVGDEFIVVKQLPTFWDWLKFAIDDIRDWIED